MSPAATAWTRWQIEDDLLAAAVAILAAAVGAEMTAARALHDAHETGQAADVRAAAEVYLTARQARITASGTVERRTRAVTLTQAGHDLLAAHAHPTVLLPVAAGGGR